MSNAEPAKIPEVWIFQANPDRFDIDQYLASAGDRITWTVNRYAKELNIGDLVYLWKAAGSKKEGAGIIAAARVDSDTFFGPDDPASQRFWKEGDPTESNDRVWLKVLRVANSKEIIRADWLKEDPICSKLQILTLRIGTNFPVKDDQAKRLEILWQKTGSTWSYAECVAALKVYSEIKDQSISKKPESPVANLALQIGRAVGGAYNKLMNFRAIDPTDLREGLKAIANEDQRVWDKFFDPIAKKLKIQELEEEYSRLWPTENANTDAAAFELQLEKRVDDLVQRPISDLNALWAKRNSKGKPRRVSATTTPFERDPLVVAIAKKRAQFRCEIPGCDWPGFIRTDGKQFIEVHHIQPLADGGEDVPENAAAICPGHHRESHSGNGADRLKSMLLKKRELDRI
jgi:predicted HNH restriction endonuclease